jgi:hypothetical protein
MKTELKAIETSYAGCRFRSRIEARWAVFFDHLGIGWEYEPQGFDLPSGRYLPDFLLDLGGGVWWEVKGAAPTQLERDLCWELLEATKQQVYLVHGAIPRDQYDDPRIEHVSSTLVRWFIQPGAIGFVPASHEFEQKGTGAARLRSAYRVARSARFEHGESPEGLAVAS